MTGIQLIRASGASLFECSFVARRYDTEFAVDLESTESWVVERAGPRLFPQLHRPGQLVDVWRAPSGATIAADVCGVLCHRRTGDLAAPWHEVDVDAVLSGVYGLAEDDVFAWGVRGGRGVAFRFDGTRWNELAMPGRAYALHGTRPDLVFAVGESGFIGRWDGARWTTMPPPAGVRLRSVFVVDDDEVYALGKHQVFVGSVYGWVELCAVEQHLYAVAKYRGVVYVGAGDEGLFRLDGDQLVEVDSTVPAGAFDARGQLLITGNHSVLSPDDAGDFTGFSDEEFARSVRDVPPLWQP